MKARGLTLALAAAATVTALAACSSSSSGADGNPSAAPPTTSAVAGGSSAPTAGSSSKPAAGSSSGVGVPLPAELASRGKLAIGVKCDYPPFGSIDTSGKNSGFEIDIAHEMAQLAFGDPDKVSLTCVTGSNRVDYLTSKRIDIIIATMNYTPDRAQTIDFSSPYFASGIQLLVPTGSSIKSYDDLAGKTVISISGSTASEWLTKCEKTAKQTLYEETSQALSALTQNRGVAFAQDNTLLADLASTNKNLEVVGTVKANSPWGMGVRKGDTATLNWVNAAIKTMAQQDFFWTDFQKTILDPSLKQEFEKYVPRPGTHLTYPTGDTMSC